MSDFAARLRQAREYSNMSLSDVARASGVSRGYIHLLEAGMSSPTIEKLTPIAEVLHVGIGELTGETAHPSMLTPAEMQMVRAFRAGDLHEMMRLALERTESGVQP